MDNKHFKPLSIATDSRKKASRTAKSRINDRGFAVKLNQKSSNIWNITYTL